MYVATMTIADHQVALYSYPVSFRITIDGQEPKEATRSHIKAIYKEVNDSMLRASKTKMVRAILYYVLDPDEKYITHRGPVLPC